MIKTFALSAALLASTIAGHASTAPLATPQETEAVKIVTARMVQAAVCRRVLGPQPYNNARNAGVVFIQRVSGSRDFALIMVSRIDTKIDDYPNLRILQRRANAAKCREAFR